MVFERLNNELNSSLALALTLELKCTQLPGYADVVSSVSARLPSK